MRGEIAAILMNISFALGFILTRKIEKDFSPLFINFIRSFIGIITFTIQGLLLGVFQYISLIPWNLILILCGSIFFTVILGDSFYFTGQKILGPTFALGIATITPFLTFILAMIFLDEKFSVMVIFSAILIGFGVIIVLKYGVQHDKCADIASTIKNDLNSESDQTITILNSQQSNIKGILFILLASIFWAIGMVLTQYSLVETEKILNLGSKTVILAYTIRFFFATLFFALLLPFLKFYPSQKITSKSWTLIIVSAIIGGSIGSYFYGEATRLVGATVVAVVSTSLPLFSIPFSYFINKEKITKWGLLGILLTMGGVIIILL